MNISDAASKVFYWSKEYMAFVGVVFFYGFLGWPLGIDQYPAIDRIGMWITFAGGVALIPLMSGIGWYLLHIMYRWSLGWVQLAKTLIDALLLAIWFFCSTTMWFGEDPAGFWQVFPGLMVLMSFISAVLFGAYHRECDVHSPRGQVFANRFLGEIPAGRRGSLLALRAEDHYVSVLTTKGETLIRCRFSDAHQSLPTSAGMRVHRSYWVAWSGVKKFTGGRNAKVELLDGSEIPVSQTYLRAFETGLNQR